MVLAHRCIFDRVAVPVLVLAVGGGVAVACAPPSGPPRGLVVVVIDTLRADHLGGYGYERPTSPRMDALAADAVLFRQAISPAPWTLPSLATLMTSLYPSVHGANAPSRLDDFEWYFDPGSFEAFSSLHPSRTTLAEVLRDAGFATFGAVQGSYPTSVFGMGQGFDRYRQNRTPGVRFDVEDALAWLDEEQPDRFFIYLHVIEVHAPYRPVSIHKGLEMRLDRDRRPYYEEAVAEERRRFLETDFDPGYAGEVDGSLENLRVLSPARKRLPPADLRQLVALYDRGIVYVDHWIGELEDGLRERGLLDELAFVVTSDHGEEFLDHGRLEHSVSYYEEMLNVPLIVRVPGEGRGTVVDETVGLVDVMPTLLDVLGVPGPEGMQGRSLRGLWRGEASTAAEGPVEYLAEASRRRGSVLRGPGFKYIRTPSPGGAREELYDLRVDPTESKNRCGSDRRACRAYRQRLSARVSEQRDRASALAAPEVTEIDDQTRDQLEALGYVDPE